MQEIARWRRGYNLPIGLWTVPDPEAASAALGRVKASGLIVGVISNSNGTVRSILEKTGLARDLDFIIDSGVVGVEKPDPRIFHLALEHARVPAAAACYVGDSIRSTWSARGGRGSTRCCSIPAATGGRATARLPAGSRTPCASACLARATSAGKARARSGQNFGRRLAAGPFSSL